MAYVYIAHIPVFEPSNTSTPAPIIEFDRHCEVVAD